MELKFTNDLAKALKKMKEIDKLLNQIEKITKQTYGKQR